MRTSPATGASLNGSGDVSTVLVVPRTYYHTKPPVTTISEASAVSGVPITSRALDLAVAVDIQDL